MWQIIRILSLVFWIAGSATGFGQALSRQEYRAELYQAIATADSSRVEEFLKSQRGEGFRFIEALLDSMVVKKARNEIEPGETEWQAAKTLAEAYSRLFGDDYYAQRAMRYHEMASDTWAEKTELIKLKATTRQLFYEGDFKSALGNYQQALKMAQVIGDEDDEAALLGNIGAVQFYLGNFDVALDFYHNSLTKLEKLGDLRRIGNRLGNIASVYSDKSDYATALDYYERALTVRRAIDDTRGMAADFNNMGLVDEEMGQYTKAVENYQAALARNKAIDNKRSMGENLANIANVHINLGDYPEAIEIYEMALALRRDQRDLKGEANDLGNLGIVYQNLGEYAKAGRLFEEALSIHHEIGFQEGEAYQIGRMAELLSLRGEYARAIVKYQEARDIHAKIGHVRGEAIWLEALGETYEAIGDNSRALDNLERALELHRRIGNPGGEARTLNAFGRIHLESGKEKEANRDFEQAAQIYKDLGEKKGQCITLANLARVHGENDDPQSAVETWLAAYDLAKTLGDPRLQVWIQLLLGNFYRDSGEQNQAEIAYEKGLALSEGLYDSELRWMLYYGRGQLWESQGENERAFYSYQAAIKIVEQIRGKAVADEMKATVLQTRLDVYEAMILLLVRMERVEEAYAYVERARARSLLDALGNGQIAAGDSEDETLLQKEQALRAKIAKLISQLNAPGADVKSDLRGSVREAYDGDLSKAQTEYQRVLIDLKLRNPAYASLVSVQPSPLKHIQKLLDSNTALLEYFVTPSATFIFVVTVDKVDVISVPEGYDNLRGKILLFRGTAVRKMDKEKLKEAHWVRPLQNLYEMLISPVQAAGLLSDKNHLVIVPQGILSYLPFQALITEVENSDGKTMPHFLIEDYIISYAPSASSLTFFRHENRKALGSLMLLAPQTERLPSSDDEVMGIAENFGPRATYYLNEAATETRMKTEASHYDLLHLATTAYFNKANPLFSRLDLAESEQDDGHFEVHEIFGLHLDATVVTLSACETALGSGYTAALPQGDDLVSLANAFLYAGATCVVASLWEVSDPSTSALMQTFYQYLKSLDKAEALAGAQRDIIKGKTATGNDTGDGSTSHPYFWSSFVLIGDWQ